MAGAAVDLLGTPVKPVEGTRAKRGAIPVWAERYGYGARQIKNWLADGRDAKDLPPLDKPAEMAAWFERRYSKKPPTRLLDVIEQLTGVARPVETKGEGVPGPAVVPFEMPTIADHELGIEAQLNGYRREFAMLAKLRERALNASEFTKASGFLTQQQLVSAEIRQLEKMLPTVLEQRGDFQRSADVRRATVELLNILKTSLFGHVSKCSSKLRDASSDAEIEEIWRREINLVFGRCCEQRFTAEFELAS